MRTVITTVLVAVAAVVGLTAGQAPPAHRFGLDEFSRVARVAEPQIAPDAKSIAVIVAHPNLDEDRYDTELVSVDIATGAQHKLSGIHPGMMLPRWSPDGQRIAFIAMSGPEHQIYVMKATGGDAKAITNAPRGVQQLAWSPDGKTIAFATQDELVKQPGFERFNDSFEVTPSTDFLMTAAVQPTHVWIVPSAGGESKRLTSGAWTLPIAHPPGPPPSLLTWTPDGTGVVFNRNGGRGAGGGAGGGGGGGGTQVVNVADGSIKPLANVSGSFPQFSPTDPNSVLFMGRGASVTDGKTPAKMLTQAIDRNIARALWMPDGKSVLVGANDSTRVSMWIQPLDGPARKVDVGDESPNSSFYVDMNVGKDGSIAFAGSNAMHPAELYYMASSTSAVKQLTHVNDDLAALPLGKTDVVEWKNDSFNENGLLTYPPDFNPSQKYPLVLVIHGGPRAASLLGFSPQAQILAAKGWVVFQPNYRGSDNLGNAYDRAISGNPGDGPGKDVIAGIETIKARGIVDETRMAVSGWSYGGYMTTWMLGHYNIWKAAVAGAAVTDEIDQKTLGDDAGGGRGNPNSYWVNPQAMERERANSPITYVSKMKAPTLILSDVGDYRVVITQSYKLFHGLLDNGVPTQFFAYPVSGHSPTDPVRQRDVQKRWAGWLEQYLNAPPVTKVGGGK